MELVHDEENNCGLIVFKTNKHKIIVDYNQSFFLFNHFHKRAALIFKENDNYPYYMKNKKKIELPQLLYGYKFDNQIVKFRNKNKYDLSKKNLIIMHEYSNKILRKYKIKKYISGHICKSGGEHSGLMKNPVWVTDKGDYIMYLNKRNGKNRCTFLCEESFKKLKEYEKEKKCNLSFYIGMNNHPTSNGNIYMAEVIIGKKMRKKNNYHFDKNPLNNRMNNLNFDFDKDDTVSPKDNQVENEYSSDEESDEECNITRSKKSLAKIIKKDYPHVSIVSYSYGRDLKKGRNSGKKNVNSKFTVNDTKLKKIYILMHIKNKLFTKISCDYQVKLDTKDAVWYLFDNGYIASRYDSDKFIYLHQLITGYYGNKGNNMSVDHINRDKLDNRTENLRIVNQSVQNANQDKRSRKSNAQKLPNGITDDMIPKYCYYCSEKINSPTMGEYTREFFRIEKHPQLTTKCWSSSKSTKVTILNKLQQAKRKLQELDGVIEEAYKLPRYIVKKDKPNNKIQLIYDRKENGQRQNMRATYTWKPNTNEKLDECVKNFQTKITNKYSDYSS